MVAGLNPGEELELALALNRRYRAAIEIAVRALSTARDHGHADASKAIAGINDALSRPVPAPGPPLWPKLANWAADVVLRRARAR